MQGRSFSVPVSVRYSYVEYFLAGLIGKNSKADVVACNPQFLQHHFGFKGFNEPFNLSQNGIDLLLPLLLYSGCCLAHTMTVEEKPADPLN